MMMRFADLSGGLLGALTGQGDIASTGLVGLIPGAPNVNGALGLAGSLGGMEEISRLPNGEQGPDQGPSTDINKYPGMGYGPVHRV
jgi:hypothetical protein